MTRTTRKSHSRTMATIIDALCRVAFGLFAVVDPQDGDGWKETLLAGMLIIGVVMLLAMDKEIPAWAISIVSAAAGGYLGHQIQKHSPEK